MRFWLSVVLSCLLSSAALANPRVILATTTWEPYVQNNPIYKGYVYNIVKAAYESSGYDVVIKFMPWDDAIHALKAGVVDGIFPKYYSGLDHDDMLFSKPFTGGPLALYHRSDKPFRFAVKDPAKHLDKVFAGMTQYKFGVVSGYHHLPAFDHNQKIEKIAVPSDKANLEQLYAGKVDFIIIDHFNATNILKNHLSKDMQKAVTFVPPPLGYQQLYLAVSRSTSNSAKLIRDFNRGLKQIKQNGELEKILDKDAHFTGHLVA